MRNENINSPKMNRHRTLSLLGRGGAAVAAGAAAVGSVHGQGARHIIEEELAVSGTR